MLLAQVLLVTAVFSWLLPKRFHALAAVAGLLSLIPVPEVSLAMALRGLWGDPSITTLQLLALGLMGRSPTAFASGWRAPLLLALIGTIFYPLALGLGDFDPYRLGYQPWLLIAVLALPALVFWWRGQHLWLWLLTIDLLAWAAGLPESPNLWDTLLDPLLVLACLFLAARNGWRTYKHPS
ncbi:MAG TPA: hypothetical protein VGK09_07370 [Rhodocyclaceae bacterium]|jgi:hypothetical protein